MRISIANNWKSHLSRVLNIWDSLRSILPVSSIDKVSEGHQVQDSTVTVNISKPNTPSNPKQKK